MKSPFDLPAPANDWVDLASNAAGQGVQVRASAEYDALRRRYTAVGAALLKWTDQKTEERAWRVGADGERRVGGLLDRLVQRGFHVLHCVPVGGLGSDIDHVVIGPPGVFTVNTKRHPGARIWVGGGCVKINGCNRPYVRNSRFEAQRASRLLGHQLGWVQPVTALLVFDTTGGGSLTVKHPPDDVVVIGHRTVGGWLLKQPHILDRSQVGYVFDIARRSSTWIRPRSSTSSESGCG